MQLQIKQNDSLTNKLYFDVKIFPKNAAKINVFEFTFQEFTWINLANA